MLNRRHIRRNAGFQRISGRPVRASDVSIGLEDFYLELKHIYNNRYGDKDITNIYNEIQNYLTEGDIYDPDYIMEYAREISEKTGLQYKVQASFLGGANMRILFHKGSGYEISISFITELTRSGLEKFCNAMSNLS